MNLYSTYVRSNLSSAKFVLSRKAFCHKVKFSHLFFLLGMSWGLFCARSSAFYQMHIKVWSSDSYRQKTGDIQPSCGLGCQRRVGPPAFACTVPHGCFWFVASGRQTSWMSLVLPRRHASTIHVWLSPKARWPARMMTLRSCMASACNMVPSAPAAEWIGGNKSHRPNPCWFIWCTVSKTSLGRTAFCRLPGFVKRPRCASRMPPDFRMRCLDSCVWTVGSAPSLRQDSGTCSLWWCFGMTDSWPYASTYNCWCKSCARCRVWTWHASRRGTWQNPRVRRCDAHFCNARKLFSSKDTVSQPLRKRCK